LKKHLLYILLIVNLLIAGHLSAQQAPMFTQYKYTYMFSNPAFAGMSEGICVNGLLREQWSGFKDSDGNKIAPQDFLLTGDAPIKILHGGVGLSIIQDKIGFETNIGVQLAYSFHAELSFATLGIGAGFNLTNRTIDFSKFKPLVEGDPVLLSAETGDMLFDANFGIFLNSPGRYYFGLSAINLLESEGKNLGTDDGVIKYKTDRTFFLTGGYIFYIPSNPKFEIEASALIQSDVASTQYNISGIVKYNSRFWGGVNYRLEESVGLLVGMSIKDFSIGYSYDLNIMGLGVPGSHEVALNYCFKLKPDRSKTSYKNTRYL
jgi:type IX secretion system PorP/SprF family membrane protein